MREAAAAPLDVRGDIPSEKDPEALPRVLLDVRQLVAQQATSPLRSARDRRRRLTREEHTGAESDGGCAEESGREGSENAGHEPRPSQASPTSPPADSFS